MTDFELDTSRRAEDERRRLIAEIERLEVEGLYHQAAKLIELDSEMFDVAYPAVIWRSQS